MKNIIILIIGLLFSLTVNAQEIDPSQPFLKIYPPDTTHISILLYPILREAGWEDFDAINLPIEINCPRDWLGSWLEVWIKQNNKWYLYTEIGEPLKLGLKHYLINISPGGDGPAKHSFGGYDVHVYFINPENNIELSDRIFVPHPRN